MKKEIMKNLFWLICILSLSYSCKQTQLALSNNKKSDKIYTKAHLSLNDIDFSLKTGEISAIVGLSGAGKSSILDLLVGLFKPNSGDILIDNSNLNDLNLINWQRKVSIVSQDPYLLNGSIIDNLKFGLEKSLNNFLNIQTCNHKFLVC